MKLRNTHQKEAIFAVMSGEGVHLTAEEVLAKAREIDGNIGMATVYRNLNAMLKDGRIQKITGKGWSKYDGNPQPHDHMVCVKCGRLMDIPFYDDGKICSTAEEISGGKVLKYSILYEGLCNMCSQSIKEDDL